MTSNVRGLTAKTGASLLSFSIFCCTQAAQAKEMVGWKLLNPGNNSLISTGVVYQLYNTDQESNLILKDRTGANLGWNRSAPANAQFQTKDGGPITCGKPFALMLGSGGGSAGYKVGPNGSNAIMYEKQYVGINLSDRGQLKDSYYQWKFVGCSEGTSLDATKPLVLFNTVANDSLVGCWRTLGVNLCWAGDTVTVKGYNIRSGDLVDAKKNYDKVKVFIP